VKTVKATDPKERHYAIKSSIVEYVQATAHRYDRLPERCHGNSAASLEESEDMQERCLTRLVTGCDGVPALAKSGFVRDCLRLRWSHPLWETRCGCWQTQIGLSHLNERWWRQAPSHLSKNCKSTVTAKQKP
jgi:hypothetical protein